MTRRGFFATSMWEDIKQELGVLDKEDEHAHRLGLPDGSVRMRLDGHMEVLGRPDASRKTASSLRARSRGGE